MIILKILKINVSNIPISKIINAILMLWLVVVDVIWFWWFLFVFFAQWRWISQKRDKLPTWPARIKAIFRVTFLDPAWRFQCSMVCFFLGCVILGQFFMPFLWLSIGPQFFLFVKFWWTWNLEVLKLCSTLINLLEAYFFNNQAYIK